MYEYVLQRCEFVFWIILILCPKGSYLALMSVQNLSLKYSQGGVNSFEQGLIKEDANSVKALEGNIITLEAGFDLSEQEIKKFRVWPSGIIPYYIDVYSFSDKVLRDRIRSFLNMVNSVTSLKFLELPTPPKDDDSRWVFFINRRGLLNCADHSIKTFTTRGVQQVILGYECMSTGNELAEAVLSLVGIPAQHSSPDRDQYIRVSDENIIPDKKYLFEKLKDNEWLFYDINYDFASAGHYHSHKYSSTGRATIEMRQNYLDIPVGETNGFSDKDILKINMLYNFISKTKENITDCHKLFVPGADFKNYRPDDTTVKPRNKPNQYLGLPKEQSSKTNEDKLVTEDSTEEEDGHNPSISLNEESDETNKELVLNAKNTTDAKINVTHRELKYDTLVKDPLSLLSDFETNEN